MRKLTSLNFNSETCVFLSEIYRFACQLIHFHNFTVMTKYLHYFRVFIEANSDKHYKLNKPHENIISLKPSPPLIVSDERLSGSGGDGVLLEYHCSPLPRQRVDVLLTHRPEDALRNDMRCEFLIHQTLKYQFYLIKISQFLYGMKL